MKFQIGDRVKILSKATSVGVEFEDVGKIGVISFIISDVIDPYGIYVQMDEVCKAKGYTPTWVVGSKMIELIPRKNQQLLFNFMDQL